jgi:hypothetical protein
MQNSEPLPRQFALGLGGPTTVGVVSARADGEYGIFILQDAPPRRVVVCSGHTRLRNRNM